VIRIAAVGDIHFGADASGTLRPHFEQLPERADLLLLAGDLSRRGRPSEAEVLVDELTPLPVPMVAVLGNHEFESEQQDEYRRVLEDAGVAVLEGDSTTIAVDGATVGIAGTVGFGGGFPGATCADFGEPLMKAFVARSRELADSLEPALEDLDTDLRIALTHYAPTRETVVGEKPEIYPFLGSHLLAEAIDRAGADLAIHGHAHAGTERGATPGGVPVRNVAQPVIGQAYHVYEMPARERASGG
jgi:Icc-related predicted phosphoesterase